MMLKSVIRWLCGFILAASSLACGDELAGGPRLSTNGANLFTQLEVNHPAVLLSIVAPYDTVQLRTSPKDVNGDDWFPDYLTEAERDSVLAANPPVYTTQDETRVRVSASGLVRAVGITTVTGTVRVVATRQIGNITHADTTLVRVLNEPSPPKIKTFLLRPADSLKVAAASALPLILTALDSSGVPILRVVTYARSYNPTIIGIGNEGKYSGWNPAAVAGGRNQLGTSRIISKAYVYGIAIADTMTMMNGYSIQGNSGINILVNNKGGSAPNLYYPHIRVGPGGIVAWENQSKLEPISIVFDDPSNVLPAPIPSQNSGGGNIIDIPSDSTLSNFAARTRYRRFLVPGVYTYRTVPYGLTGSVVVKDR